MTSEEGLPAGLRRLWGLSEPARLGRPAELDVRRVVAAAVELADRDGLAGVTLPKVAKELGFTSMSLYRYIGSKDELLVLMRDAGLGPPPPEITRDAKSWRDGLRRWADDERHAYLRRPWLARVPLSGPPSGPNEIARMEVALAVLRDTGLDWAAKVGVLALVSGYVRHSALLFQDLAHGRAEGVDQAGAERDYGRALAKLVEPDRFPETAKLFASPLFETPDQEADYDFTFGLELILDGVEVTVRRADERS
ncbi:TetR/AcrR family transcriptional regulator [Amycolatopsis nigrescens]|uniref:TetR/AcrR family transcriptional regulator n=1 Tax=Amycolatopsis nigrescens TaxID=381445 RepID=UPI00035F93F1|nr:TetR/AcrR family transcriptional regulator [Amycolatopsis nigrescens]